MKGFFKRYRNYKNLVKSSHGELAELETEELEKALFLALLYSTCLNARQLKDLSQEKARKLLLDPDFELEGDAIYLLKRLLKDGASSKSKLFSKAIQSADDAELDHWIRGGLDQEFLRRLRSIRVLCNEKEFNVLPTPLRLNADPRYSGKGICIAFLDGGFYPHPDLMKPHRRVVAYKDLASPYRPKSDFEKPDEYSWHGMQTCVSAVGNGHLSNGLYRGIAYEANVAQLKVMGEFGFTSEAIVQALEWCIRKKKRYNLRIINISLGGFGEGSFRESAINHAAEEAVQAGINVVVAAGNDWSGPITPPGNSPSVITVGGLDDRNSLHSEDHGMYHSSFGMTADGLMKPEIIAPGIWVAAPTLPGTAFYREAELVWRLAYDLDLNHLEEALKHEGSFLSFQDDMKNISTLKKQEYLRNKAGEFKLVSPYYQHVDGTSFSAPIVCSIIAQMLEVNPDLTPKEVKDILMQSAKRLDNVPVEAQGCGVVQARDAVEMAKKRVSMSGVDYPLVKDDLVELRFEDENVSSVHVLGTFNNWDQKSHPMVRDKNGIHQVKLQLPEKGTYAYKFLVNGKSWVDDPMNSSKSYDGYGGFNSLIHIYGSASMRKELQSIQKGLEKIESVKLQGEEHKKLLRRFNKIAMGENISRSPQLSSFFENRVRKVVQNLKDRKLEDGIFLYQLYNSGYIIQTPTINLGIDVVSTRHVWDVYWDIDRKLVEDLSDRLQMAFVTQRLPDHLDLDVVNRLISRESLVVVPSGMENLCLNGVIGFEDGEVRDLYSLGRETIPINIEAYRSDYRLQSAGEMDMRMYKITILERLNLLHLGECDYKKMLGRQRLLLEKLKPIDVCIAPMPVLRNPGDENDFLEFMRVLDPDVIIPSHLGELGQKDLAVRGDYEKALEVLDRTGKEFEVLLWGDSIKIASL